MSNSIETQEVRDFLRRFPPFDQLKEILLEHAAGGIKVSYHRRGCDDLLNSEKLKLYMVRSGAFEVRSQEGQLLDRVDAGGYFGYPSLLTGEPINNRVQVLEDGLVYQLNEITFRELRALDSDFDRFFNLAYAKRLRKAVSPRDINHYSSQKLTQLMTANPICLSTQATIQQAAEKMTKARVSSLLVVEEGTLKGILTDRDLRVRVLAAGADGQSSVAEMMTAKPVTIEPQAYVFEAVLLMSQNNIHHLPVLDENGELPGIISSTDILKAQKSDPVLLIGDINRQADIAGLQRVSRDTPELLRNLMAEDVRAEEVGRIATTITDALTRQLIRQAIDRLGEPPVAFAWLAFGSQGRCEQTAATDQDNGLLLADDAKPEHDSYFQALASHVCDGLNACGYEYCPGDIMATTDRWRQPLAIWKDYFLQWILEPSPKALMHASIFFDLRAIAGDLDLARELQQTILNASRDNSIFLAAMAQNALSHTPPLGFFRQFVLEHDGEQAKTLDMKLRGVVPIIDIARLYALATGSEEVNTPKRLQAVVAGGGLTLRDSRELRDAYEYIGHLRLKNQAQLLARGEAASNHMPPDSMSDLVRHQLRDAFNLVIQAQSALQLKFTRGLL